MGRADQGRRRERRVRPLLAFLAVPVRLIHGLPKVVVVRRGEH
jgi:hypothetical protein